jgi:hypothetical protein
MQSLLAEAGSDFEIEIVGWEDRPLALEARARELVPDAVVLALEARGAQTLCERIRLAAPGTTVFLWSADAELEHIWILEPGATTLREVGSGDLPRELIAIQTRYPKE